MKNLILPVLRRAEQEARDALIAYEEQRWADIRRREGEEEECQLHLSDDELNDERLYELREMSRHPERYR